MRRPLFLKIALGVCISAFLVMYLVWAVDSFLQRTPSRSAAIQARIAMSGLRTAVELGGEPALKAELKNWPEYARHFVKYNKTGATDTPQQNPHKGAFATAATAPDGQRYEIRYTIFRFDGYVEPPLVFHMGPHIFTGMAIGVIFFSALLTLYLTAPIRRIRDSFSRLSSGDLKTRLGESWFRRKDEFSDLARDFNKMATQLEDLVTSRDRLLADISHELRSPLARLQLAIELVKKSPEKLDKPLHRIMKEADKLEELVGELLTLTKFETQSVTTNEVFFVSEIVDSVVDDARFEAHEKGVEIVYRLHPDIVHAEALVRGSSNLISRAIENVIRNALRFSGKGTTVTVELNFSPKATFLSIIDQGPGVRVEKLGSLFEPFTQGETSGGHGYGLGLSIAKRAIVAHGGTITASNGPTSGLAIRIRLPVAGDTVYNEERFTARNAYESGFLIQD